MNRSAEPTSLAARRNQRRRVPPLIVNADANARHSKGDSTDRLALRQIELLYANSTTGIIAALPALALLLPLLWNHSDRQGLLLWAALVLIVNLARLLHLRRMNTTAVRPCDVVRLRRYYLVWNTMSGMAWGSAALLAFPETTTHQMFLALVMGGLAAAAVAVHAAMFKATVAFTVPVIVPMAARLYFSGGVISLQTSLAALLFLGVLLFTAARLRKIVVKALDLGIVNEDILSYLKTVNDDTEKLNVDLIIEVRERRLAEDNLRTERDFISSVLDTGCVLVIVLDPSGGIVRVNQACENTTGYCGHELVGHSIWDTLVPKSAATNLRLMLESVRAGCFPTDCECQWVAKDGRQLIVQLFISAIQDSDGKVVNIVSTGVDVTERRIAQIELERTRQDFQLLVEGVTGYAIYMLDTEGRLTTWNAGAARITGYDAAEIIGTHFSCLYPLEVAGGEQTFPCLRMAISEDRHEFEGWSLRKDGTRFWAVVAVSSLLDDAGQLCGFSVITGDLSQRKETEDTIRALLEISECLNSTLDIETLMDTRAQQSMKLVDAEVGHVGLLRDGVMAYQSYCDGDGDGEYAHRQYSAPVTAVLAQQAVKSGKPCRSAFSDADTNLNVLTANGERLCSAICCPILDYSGHVLGFVELHNRRKTGYFSATDEKRLASVSQTASLAVQNSMAYQKIMRAERWLLAEARILELIANGADQNVILRALLSNMQQALGDSCVMLLPAGSDGECLSQAIVPDGFAYCNGDGAVSPPPSCQGYGDLPEIQGRRTLIYNIGDDDAWRQWLNTEQLVAYPTRWMCPIHSRDERSLGILIICQPENISPTDEPLILIENAAHLAGIAIERKRVDDRLLLHERAIESSLNAILVVGGDPQRRPIIYANPATARITGHSATALIGKDWLSLYSSTTIDSQYIVAQLNKAIVSECETNVTVQGLHKDGQCFWAEVFVAPVRDITGQVTHFVVVMHDISARVDAEQALRESERKFKAITANIPGMVYQLILQPDGAIHFSYASAGSIGVCGLSAEKIISDSAAFSRLLTTQDDECFRRSMAEAACTSSTWTWEARLCVDNSDARWISARSSSRLLGSGVAVFDGIMFNVTEHMLAEIELKESQAQLRALSVHLQRVREDEKAHIARELHDELGSTLTALSIDTSWVKRHLPSGLDELDGKCTTILDLLGSALSVTRRISSDLRPPILDDLGLIATIEWQVREFESRMGIPCKLQVTGDGEKLDDMQSIALFRILQEALTNITRHAQASRVWLTISISCSHVSMQIQDDGKGIDSGLNRRQDAHGLHGMHERAKSLGGDLSLENSPEKGTTLTVCIPMNQAVGQTATR